ncbi:MULTISPECIES: MlaD family protein [unclassified Massilia]|uniref:MlaD family protein n=1 Tax=unclassified Massilia TaxID=2609279 RepID=UPI001783AF19|nr:MULTISPECIES: mammalian cell entry protein [unclassified Massilia]MBD8530145.1 mammalian cell entry protein [Massilia sp. CFBP 13647]MBD8674026.1 mammalian cell entry protein [Massilia sp. CFBP 13721]
MTHTPPDESVHEPAHVETRALILLALVAALLVAFVLYVMYARGVFEATQKLILTTENSEGVIPGMDMTFAGFPIGRVRLVELAQDGKVQVVVDVSKADAKWLRTSSVFTLERSVVGETRLRAFTGVLEDAPLPGGAVRPILRGDVTAEIPGLVATAKALLDNLESMTAEDSSVAGSLENLQTLTGRLSGKYGLLSGALGDEEAKKFVGTLGRLDGLLAKTDQRLYGKKGMVDDAQAAVVELQGVLQDARTTLKKVDAVLVEAQAVGANARVATDDLGALRGEVEASLRKVNRLVDQVNSKWPFAGKTEEIKLP